MTRTKLVYLLGKNEKELLAYDEYDSEGSGKWFTDNPVMANEYNLERAVETADKEALNIYIWEATYDTNEKKIIKEEIWLQFTTDEAIKLKKDHDKE